ncbi:Restriction endonuclease BglII [Bacillus sp. THAF10]|uniref:BglII/BstYI family type II restriction endonuclease n=1 Tax=Bacillus sp. THAF10 TaxID=2587848 RepID=UPI0012A9BAB9|nr:BglII/BstYI family type II restriction endonuclease [Bacillus sp. THAF10]QFT87679.1 Restriction endonuclease BglII [Bacillus sp. THAF10]
MKNEMNQLQANAWNRKSTVELYVADEEHYRHSDLFLQNHTEVKDAITFILNGKITKQILNSEPKKNKSFKRRVEAKPLNFGIRKRFKNSPLKFKYEVTFEEGVFYDSLKTAGFDFGHIDNQYNLVNFRNLCFGRRALHNGSELWKTELGKRPLWKQISNKMNLKNEPVGIGIDVDFKKQTPTILGEIQFGNWGLVYRDILKVIQIERDEEVDLFIYVTATGVLADAISDGTVNFKKSKDVFEEYKNVLSMPIWLIGIDIK